MKPHCPHCNNQQRQVKAGRTRSGSQRYYCPLCDKDYTPVPRPLGYPAELRRQAVELCREGISQRQVARRLGVSQQSVRNWIKAALMLESRV